MASNNVEHSLEEVKNGEIASHENNQGNKKTLPLTPGELSRPTNIQRIQQKKSQVKSLPRLKKLEKLAVYSSCKVRFY